MRILARHKERREDVTTGQEVKARTFEMFRYRETGVFDLVYTYFLFSFVVALVVL